MFVMTVPQFADVLAPIPTTHNPMAFFAVSLIALASNVALAAYQLYRIRKLKLNPLKDQIYAGARRPTSASWRRTSRGIPPDPACLEFLPEPIAATIGSGFSNDSLKSLQPLTII